MLASITWFKVDNAYNFLKFRFFENLASIYELQKNRMSFPTNVVIIILMVPFLIQAS